MYPIGLVNVSVGQLVASAGGDPWKLDEELQAGDSAAIDHLADAYHRAAGCVEEAESDFVDAKVRFEQSYRRNVEEHPINDSAEVIETTTRLQLERSQIAAIAVHLETIAAALATAQQQSDAEIAGTNTTLHQIDDDISTAESAGQDASPLYDTAVKTVDDATAHVHAIRSTYLSVLASAQAEMLAATGYVAEALPAVDAAPDEAAAAADDYDQNRRATDQAAVDRAAATGVQSAEAVDAAARLRDSDTVRNPTADPAARRLAGERLADFRDSKLVGPLPTDTVLGGDARSRAQARLQGQKLLESGFNGGAQPMTPDQATLSMDRLDAMMRQDVLNSLEHKLLDNGVSAEGAKRLIDEVEQGKPPGEIIREAAQTTGMAAELVGTFGEKASEYLHTGSHWQPGEVQTWAKADAEKLMQIGKWGHGAAIGIDGLLSVASMIQGAPPLEELAKLGGGAGGGMVGDSIATALLAFGAVAAPEVEVPALLVATLYATMTVAGAEGGKAAVEGALGG